MSWGSLCPHLTFLLPTKSASLQSIITNFIEMGGGRRNRLHQLSLEAKVAIVFRDNEYECGRFNGSTLDIEVVFTTSWADSFIVVFHWVCEFSRRPFIFIVPDCFDTPASSKLFECGSSGDAAAYLLRNLGFGDLTFLKELELYGLLVNFKHNGRSPAFDHCWLK